MLINGLERIPNAGCLYNLTIILIFFLKGFTPKVTYWSCDAGDEMRVPKVYVSVS